MQFDLFPPPPLDTTADAALAAKRPAGLFLGTSSWTFRGWSGLVYRGAPSQEHLVEFGLEEYARHPLFNTVAIDRSYYAPLSVDELAHYARQLPDGFRCVQKVWNAVTSRVDPRTRAPNPQYLDPGFFKDAVLAPVEKSFAAHQGPLLFQFLPLGRSELPSPTEFSHKLERFFSQLPKHFQYAVELRNSELMTPSYFAALQRQGVSHVFNHWSGAGPAERRTSAAEAQRKMRLGEATQQAWERMPAIRDQLANPASLTSQQVVCRLLLPQGMGYEEAREQYEPFDRIQAVDEPMREDVVALWKACRAAGRSLIIIVNNKAEGSSPLTVRALLQRLTSLE